MLNALKGYDVGNKEYVLLMRGDLHHVESGAKFKSPRQITFIDGHYHDWRCIKKSDERFGLKGEPRS